MKQLALLLLAIFCGTALGQDLPKTQDKLYLSIFTHSDWANRPNEVRLIESLKAEPLLSVVLNTHFNHYTPAVKMYQERWKDIFPESDFPVIILQQPSGGYIYKASGSSIPATSIALEKEMKDFARLIPSNQPSQINKTPTIQPEGEGDDAAKRPFFPRDEDEADDGELPDSIDIFGGRMPFRDTVASGAAMFQAAAVMCFLLLATAIAALVLKVFK